MILCFKTLQSSLKVFQHCPQLVVADLLGISGQPCLLGSRYRPKYLESSGNRAISTNTHLMSRFRRNMAHKTARLSNKIDAILYAVQPVHVQTKRDTWKALLQQGSQGLRICPKHSYARTYVLFCSFNLAACANCFKLCTTLDKSPHQFLFFLFRPHPP